MDNKENFVMLTKKEYLSLHSNIDELKKHNARLELQIIKLKS
jgi:hypothetical protein